MIEIEIGGRVIELTLEEARGLDRELSRKITEVAVEQIKSRGEPVGRLVDIKA